MTTEKINEYIKRINCEIDSLFKNKEPDSLYQPMHHLLKAGGKRIRPVLLILTCSTVGGSIKDCLKAAVAVELLHTFTLVHDDIMDHDDLRRGIVTVHKKWDEPTAILSGDGLVTLAYMTLLETESDNIKDVVKCFTDGLLILCEGQAMDKDFEERDDVSLEEYMDMIERKTARLIEVSCEAGGILGRADEEEIKIIRKFSFALGKAFQIQDDLLDILSDEIITGKPVGSDLIAKKKTYLIIHFLNNAAWDDIEKFQRIWNKEQILNDDVKNIKDLFYRAGSISAAEKEVSKLIDKSIENIQYLKACKSRDQLENLVFQIKKRNS